MTNRWRRCASIVAALMAVALVWAPVDAKHRVVKGFVPVQLVALAPDSAQQTAFNRVIARFEKAYSYIKVTFTPITQQWYAQTSQAVVSKTADVFEVDAGWYTDFASNGYLQRQDTYARATKSFRPHDFLKNVREAFNYKGAQYAYPTGLTTLGLWYNKALLRSERLNSPPRKWKGFASDACKLTDSSSHQVGAVLAPDAYHWFSLLGGWGARVLNKSKTAAEINSKQSVSALSSYVGLIRKGCAETPPGGSSDVAEFAKGAAAMTIEASTSIPSLQSTAPSLNLGVAPLPKGPKGQSDIVDAVGFAINAASTVKTASWKLIQFLNTSSSMRTLDAAAGFVPGRSSVRPAKGTSVFLRAVPNSDNWAWPPELEFYAFPHVDSDIQSASAGSMTPAAAATDMEYWLSQYLPAKNASKRR